MVQTPITSTSRVGRSDATSMADQAKKLLIVDDHPFVREGLKQLLATQNEFVVVAKASTIEDARAAVSAHAPDVAVVDLTLATEDGTELVRWIRAEHPGIAILVLSMQDEALFAERMLRLGVQGYVMKSAAAADFLTALRRVSRGQKHVSASIGERLLAQVARGRARDGDEPVAALTARELGIFRLIGSGISTREISKQLDLSMKTVDAHRRHMREKLNLRSTSELIRYATQWVADDGDGAGVSASGNEAERS
jgi:DNA-binding NarL/FixJ family response regulator